MIGWKDEYSVGVPEIDAQHREIFRLAAEADQALAEGRTVPTIDAVVAFLADYCETHFGHEQRLMARVAYPEARDHLAQHGWFVREVRRLERDVAVGLSADESTMRLDELLGSWLVKHIATFDAALAAWLRAHPPS